MASELRVGGVSDGKYPFTIGIVVKSILLCQTMLWGGATLSQINYTFIQRNNTVKPVIYSHSFGRLSALQLYVVNLSCNSMDLMFILLLL